jgi:hypothetical protein
MKNRLLAIVSALVAAALAAGTAAATEMTVAGWDFSQYLSDGVLSTDGTTYTTTLEANYSDFDPTHGAGAESADYGTMYMNGAFTSTSVSAGSGSEEVLPMAGSLQENITGPAQAPGENSFDALSTLKAEGQLFTQKLSLTAPSSASIVFEADLTAAATTGEGWELSFGGKTLSGTSTVMVDFSSDGSSFSNVGMVDLDTEGTEATVFLSAATLTKAYVRLGLDPSAGQPVIDNVAIALPEPTWSAQILAGVVGLLVLRRFRI